MEVQHQHSLRRHGLEPDHTGPIWCENHQIDDEGRALHFSEPASIELSLECREGAVSLSQVGVATADSFLEFQAERGVAGIKLTPMKRFVWAQC